MIDVRRLAAADMWGTRGTVRRRRVILVEFVAGAIGCALLGVVALVTANSWVWVVIGVWLIGVGINYVPLALHAVTLSRPGALEAELRDVPLKPALRTATVQQVWIFVPLAVAVAAIAQARR
jgi:hypothetical protein